MVIKKVFSLMKLNCRTIVALVASLATTVGSGKKPKPQGLYEKVSPACVEVLVGGRLDGSGAIVSTEGLVLTACHVIRKSSKRYEALTATAGRLPLKLLATDRSLDLALLALPKRAAPYPALAFAKSIPPEGTRVYLFGSPVFRHRLLLNGSVAGRSSRYEWYDGAFTETYAIAGIGAGGSSGGPWLNGKGEIIGVQVASVAFGEKHQGVSSAIPVARVREFALKRKTVTTATLDGAVEELWGQSPEYLAKVPPNLHGLVLRQVRKEGSAAKAGLKDEEILLEVDGKKYERIEPFLKMVRSKRPGDELRLRVADKQGENPRKVTIKLAELK